MSAVGSYEVLTRTRFAECLALAEEVRRGATGASILRNTKITGLDEFQRRWADAVLERVDFGYSGYVLGNYLDAQYAINGLRLFDDESATAVTLAKVFTAAFVFDAPRTLPELPENKLQSYARDEYGGDGQDLIEPIRAAHAFYARGMTAITRENLVVFIIR
jgi:hypothetical protein